jgi:mono/diheme cytochrome c family protein
MPRPIIYAALILVILAMIPPALIARSRAVPNDRRRIHFIQDMDNQGKFRAQQVNPMFADNRAMRPPVVNTVAQGELHDDEHFTRGLTKDDAGKPAWVTTLPTQIPVTMDLVKRGQERFGIYCTPCHGMAGYGDGIVNKRGQLLVLTGANGTAWVQAKNIHEPQIRSQPVGQIFNSITHGIRTMAGYEGQIPTADRWAIVAYVKALQRSQHAEPNDIPADVRDRLELIKLPAAPASEVAAP